MTDLILFSSIFFAIVVVLLPKDLNDRWWEWTTACGNLLPYLWLTMRLPGQDQAGEDILMQVDRLILVDPQLSFKLTISGSNLPLVLGLAPLFFLISLGIWLDRKEYTPLQRRWLSAGNLLSQGACIGLVSAASLFNVLLFWALLLAALYTAVSVGCKTESEPLSQRAPWASGFTIQNGLFVVFLISILIMIWSLSSLGNSLGTYDISATAERAATALDPTSQWWILLGLFASIVLLAPVFPVHGWIHAAPMPPVVSALVLGLAGNLGLFVFVTAGLQVLPDASEPFRYAMSVTGLTTVLYSVTAAPGAREASTALAYHSMAYKGLLLFLAASNTGAAAAALAFGLVFTPYLVYHRALVETWQKNSATEQDQAAPDRQADSNDHRFPVWASIIFGVVVVLGAFLPGSPGFVWVILTLSSVNGSLVVSGILLLWLLLNGGFFAVHRHRLAAAASEIAARKNYLAVGLMALLLIVGLIPGIVLRWLQPLAVSLLP